MQDRFAVCHGVYVDVMCLQISRDDVIRTQPCKQPSSSSRATAYAGHSVKESSLKSCLATQKVTKEFNVNTVGSNPAMIRRLHMTNSINKMKYKYEVAKAGEYVFNECF